MVRAILVEAGHRCSIPTCRATPVEIAHIDPWAKVREHKAENLIALCPTCHKRYDKGEMDRQSMLIYKQQNQQLQQLLLQITPKGSASAARVTSASAVPHASQGQVSTSFFERIPDNSRVELSDYELVWPPHLFVEEAVRIIGGSQRIRSDNQAIKRLLEEAFRDENVADDFDRLTSSGFFGRNEPLTLTADQFVREIVARVHEIPMQSSPRPYWRRSSDGSKDQAAPDVERACREFAVLISEFAQNGYLDQAFPRGCVDDPGIIDVDPRLEIERRLGIVDAWPLDPRSWDEDILFGLMEVFHDFVSRPRTAYYHDFSDCGMHYNGFATETGRKLYRWRVNRILKDSCIPYRISEIGESIGRIVSTDPV
ncbi:HNH endonuclease signature motif containing protein [Actinoallomurus sp. NPDC052308]|uniref:HNH endonuclease signature motif containing protein n=1 Tax=Actinoallomurus sp. NPDC052308 TaxID=3155530 RepID=UPI00342B04BE